MGAFYGPHECADCGRMIVRAAREDGGAAFDVPKGQIYPNTGWRKHHCEAEDLERRPQPEPCTEFGREVRRCRSEQRRSLRELEAQTGVSAATINRMERGEDVMLSNAARIASVLGISLMLLAADIRVGAVDGVPPA